MGLADRDYMRRRSTDEEPQYRGEAPPPRPVWIIVTAIIAILLLLRWSC